MLVNNFIIIFLKLSYSLKLVWPRASGGGFQLHNWILRTKFQGLIWNKNSWRSKKAQFQEGLLSAKCRLTQNNRWSPTKPILWYQLISGDCKIICTYVHKTCFLYRVQNAVSRNNFLKYRMVLCVCVELQQNVAAVLHTR